jgi:hypothetical protein
MDKSVNKQSYRVLDPLERISEVLFGLIMVLTITGSLSVASEDHPDVRAMLIAAIGCNLAWGIIDAGMYLMARLHERRRNILMLRSVQNAPDAVAAQHVIADALPPLVASILPPDQLELMRQKLCQVLEPPSRLGMTKADGFGAIAGFLLVFLSTFPVVIPFGRCQVRLADVQRDCNRDAIHVRLCFRTLRRASTMANGAFDGRCWWLSCRDRRSARGIGGPRWCE